MLRRLTSAALAILLAAAPALSFTPAQRHVVTSENPVFHGPGSKGFLPNCSDTFAVQDILPNNATLSGGTWANSNGGTGSTASSITAGATDPLGGTTAIQVNVG